MTTAMYCKAEEVGRPAVKITITPEDGHLKLTLQDDPDSKWWRSQKLPILFERAAKSWWDPKFDSEILEGQHFHTAFPQVRKRFQFALIYIFLTAVSWCIYFAYKAIEFWLGLVVGCAIYAIFIMALLIFTYTPFYQTYHFPASLSATTITCALSLAAFYTVHPVGEDYDPEDGIGVAAGSDMSTIGMFVVAVEVITLIYTFIPMPLYICVIVAGVYSVSFETLSALYTRDNSVSAVVVKVLLHLCIHLIGVHILIMSQVRMHSTFLKVGQTVLMRRDLELEKKLKEKIIHSIMPPKVAEWLIKEGPAEDEEIQDVDGTVRKLSSPRSSQSTGGELRSLFRPFNMNKMDNVSILFADIVGFTKMSSNKTAEQLVDLLNDLFGRFDALCDRSGCEKISTLGDCYYCVSGCPEPRADHARCCVEMGLGMIATIKKFDEDTNENVNMRVGVHTGTVLCGIVGVKRFKFDVWSNDVSFANLMESTGMAGRVHISASTYRFVEDDYYVEEGEQKNGTKTYFIIGRRQDIDGNLNHPAVTGELHITARTVLSKDSKASIKSQTVDVDLPGTPQDNQEASSPMLEHYAGYRDTPRDSWSTINSRKDSGIRSRRSSIQAQHILQLLENANVKPSDLLSHRVSGYYTASQPSIMEPYVQFVTSGGCLDPTAPICESLKTFSPFRKQSDKQLIRWLQHDESHAEYFIHPPISQLSLFFIDSSIEEEYRARVHRQDIHEATPTFASSRFNTYFDVVVSLVTYIITALSCFVMFGAHIVWIVFCFVATSCQALVVAFCFKQFLNPQGSSNRLRRLYDFCTRWYPWHILGALLVSLPMMSILSNFSCQTFIKYPLRTDFFFFIFFIALVHFCNFTQLNCWMKSAIASVGVVTVLAMLESDVCTPVDGLKPSVKKLVNVTTAVVVSITPAKVEPGDDSYLTDATTDIQVSFSGTDTILFEVILDMLLLLILLWFLNREFEISYRLCFHSGLLAARDHRKMQILKDQADWLLNNIIPKHVVDYLKSTSKYSENHKDVGILFATIANFNEWYDESFCGGKECLRVLNELISDFDELLVEPHFKNVEKIKTIGTTFMAASGLNPQIRRENHHPRQQLLELMDFAFAMLDVIETFNQDMLEFNFVMRLGFNFGDVTAGVIGNTKLYYDIWGDAVNIASRMDSTGVKGQIQVPEHCVPILEEYFELKPRGTIYVKGKDNMNVYIVTAKKNGIDYRCLRKTNNCDSVSIEHCSK